MSQLVSYQCKDLVATIAMDDGKANALSLAMQAELNAALDQAASDRAIIVLTGRAGMFSGGFDLKTLGAGGADAATMLTGGFHLAQRLLTHPKPVIVACNGHALAMGVFLVMCADYALGVEGAYKIGANEVAIGLTMPRTAIEISRNRLAPAHFGRAMMSAEIYRPADAVAAGFLDRIVPEAELMTEAQAVAERLAKLNMPAHTATKQLVRENLLKALGAAIEADNAFFRALFKVQ